MVDFWKPQLKRSKLIKSYLRTDIDEVPITLDFGSAGMVTDTEKLSLHKFIADNMGGEIIGVDIRDSDTTNVIHDFNDLPYPFDTETITNIVAGEVIEHVENPFLFLKECYGLLKPGGRMVITTPSAEGLQLLMGRESPYHYYIWTVKDLRLLCEHSGFKVIIAKKINIYYNRNLFLRTLGYMIPKIRPTLFFVLEKHGNFNTS